MYDLDYYMDPESAIVDDDAQDILDAEQDVLYDNMSDVDYICDIDDETGECGYHRISDIVNTMVDNELTEDDLTGYDIAAYKGQLEPEYDEESELEEDTDTEEEYEDDEEDYEDDECNDYLEDDDYYTGIGE